MTVSPELVHDTVRHPIAVGGPLEVTTRISRYVGKRVV
jgi:hypothetical protein